MSSNNTRLPFFLFAMCLYIFIGCATFDISTNNEKETLAEQRQEIQGFRLFHCKQNQDEPTLCHLFDPTTPNLAMTMKCKEIPYKIECSEQANQRKYRYNQQLKQKEHRLFQALKRQGIQPFFVINTKKNFFSSQNSGGQGLTAKLSVKKDDIVGHQEPTLKEEVDHIHTLAKQQEEWFLKQETTRKLVTKKKNISSSLALPKK